MVNHACVSEVLVDIFWTTPTYRKAGLIRHAMERVTEDVRKVHDGAPGITIALSSLKGLAEVFYKMNGFENFDDKADTFPAAVSKVIMEEYAGPQTTSMFKKLT